MHLKNDINLVGFLRKIRQCKGDVLFQTEENDILNLRSTLSGYIFASLAGREDILYHSEIICKNKDDLELLADFLTR